MLRCTYGPFVAGAADEDPLTGGASTYCARTLFLTCAKHMAHSSRGGYPSQQPRHVETCLQRMKERCMYVYIYVHVYVYVYWYVYVYVYVYVFMHMLQTCIGLT